MKIKDEDISIVVQGPILKKAAYDITSHTTAFICERLRELFPKSEIILSTWEGEDISGIKCDQVIFNSDPGATWFNYENYDLLNNCNRLIVSTRSGINAAKRKYVLKVRSDLFVLSKSFLEYFDHFPDYNKNLKFVKNRIIAFSLYSIKSHKTSLFTMKRPYHISDWAYFGYKEDLCNLYDIPLTKEPEFSQWFLNRCKPFFDIEPHRLWKMPPEQYVTYSFFKKYTEISFEHTTDLSHNNEKISEALLANNFLVLDQTQFSLVSLKYVNFQLLFDPLLSQTAIFYHTWLKDYYQYCSLQECLPLKVRLQIICRKTVFHMVNKLLRGLNKNNRLNRWAATFIKKQYIKKNKLNFSGAVKLIED